MFADPAAAVCEPLALDAPPARGWARVQQIAVDLIKRAALRQLHATRAGERLLLRIYLIGEIATEQTLQQELLAQRPAWLVRQMDQHLAEEQAHARAFASALSERGGKAALDGDAPPKPDWLSRRKIAQWNRLAERHAVHFAGGLLVPAFAVGLCAEQMASRVLSRHCSVIGPHHPMHPLLDRVLADEARHVRLCGHTLSRLVLSHERDALATLLHEVRAIDRAWGVTGALGMWFAGVALRWRTER